MKTLEQLFETCDLAEFADEKDLPIEMVVTAVYEAGLEPMVEATSDRPARFFREALDKLCISAGINVGQFGMIYGVPETFEIKRRS